MVEDKTKRRKRNILSILLLFVVSHSIEQLDLENYKVTYQTGLSDVQKVYEVVYSTNPNMLPQNLLSFSETLRTFSNDFINLEEIFQV